MVHDAGRRLSRRSLGWRTLAKSALPPTGLARSVVASRVCRFGGRSCFRCCYCRSCRSRCRFSGRRFDRGRFGHGFLLGTRRALGSRFGAGRLGRCFRGLCSRVGSRFLGRSRLAGAARRGLGLGGLGRNISGFRYILYRRFRLGLTRAAGAFGLLGGGFSRRFSSIRSDRFRCLFGTAGALRLCGRFFGRGLCRSRFGHAFIRILARTRTATRGLFGCSFLV